MRPLEITMSAFGPYAGEITIPMNQLGEQGLYLITGDTGAGKTTIFDAICYALYGEASGANRDSTMFRSKYADMSTPTFVKMTFTHRGAVYTIRRNPEYVRPVKRGEGMTTEDADAELCMPDGTAITKIKDVNAAVEGLLGINRDQFSQIVMLAQGDFMKLLLAETKQRQEIFRNLFHTKFYQNIQNRLEEERKQIYDSCEDAKKSVNQYVAGILCAVEDERAEEVLQAKKGQLTTEVILLLLGDLLEADKEKQQVITSEKTTLEQQLDDTNQLLGKAEEAEQTRRTLAAAQEQLTQKEQQLMISRQTYDAAKAALPQKEQLQQRYSLIEATLPEYDRYEQLLEKMTADERQQTQLQTEQSRKQQETEALAAELEIQKQELAGLADAGAKREKLLAEQEKQKNQQDAYEELAERIRKLISAKEELDKLQEKYLKDDGIYQQQKNIYEHMDQMYRDAQAGILASRLVPDMPCPVCGSTTHPHLAPLTDEVPSDKELEQAKQSAEQARAAAQNSSALAGKQGATVTSMEEELHQQAQKALQGSVFENEDQITQALTEAKNALADQQQKIREQLAEEENNLARRQKLEATIPEKEKHLEDQRKDISSIQEQLAALATAIGSGHAQAEQLKTKLEFVDKKAALVQIRELTAQAEQLQKVYDQAEQIYQEQTNQAAALKGQIEGCEKALKSAENYDCEALSEQKAVLQQQKAAYELQLQAIVNRIDTNARIRDNIMDRSKELEGIEKRLQWMTALANTANGKIVGKEKIMLETYIQMTYFDRILRRANVRLLKMSGGQYDLKRLGEASNNKGQSGLELGVIDHYNGTIRNIKTLSGGESFMAALSLALGLSEEIQTSAGGIEIETMFVDEGFGTLDSNSLALAYNALASLTEGNRLVGIISHVDELKEKIDKQIIVTKDKSGGSKAMVQV